MIEVLSLRWTDYRARLARSSTLRMVLLLVIIVVPALALFGWLQMQTTVASRLPPLEAPAPPVDLPVLYGGEATLADQRGRVVVINFWDTACPPCRSEMSGLQQVADDLQADRFTLFEVDLQEDAATIDPFRQELGLRMPILLDAQGDVTQRYGVGEVPSTFLIDQQGILRQEHAGALVAGDAQTEWSVAWLEQQVRLLLAAS